MDKGYVGWLLPAQERSRLLALFPPRFAKTVAHHCTSKFGVSDLEPLPEETTATVVGECVDPGGVQALVLSIGGTTRRADGSEYHITWSLEPGRRPVESNKCLVSHGWQPVDPVEISLQPNFFPFSVSWPAV